MSKYKGHQKISNETVNEAERIARATQKPKQTKEQTRLIAQGIQKGIAEYKKQQKNKARERDRLKKKSSRKPHESVTKEEIMDTEKQGNKISLPWILLVVSWLAMAIFLITTQL